MRVYHLIKCEAEGGLGTGLDAGMCPLYQESRCSTFLCSAASASSWCLCSWSITAVTFAFTSGMTVSCEKQGIFSMRPFLLQRKRFVRHLVYFPLGPVDKDGVLHPSPQIITRKGSENYVFDLEPSWFTWVRLGVGPPLSLVGLEIKQANKQKKWLQSSHQIVDQSENWTCNYEQS